MFLGVPESRKDSNFAPRVFRFISFHVSDVYERNLHNSKISRYTDHQDTRPVDQGVNMWNQSPYLLTSLSPTSLNQRHPVNMSQPNPSMAHNLPWNAELTPATGPTNWPSQQNIPWSNFKHEEQTPNINENNDKSVKYNSASSEHKTDLPTLFDDNVKTMDLPADKRTKHISKHMCTKCGKLCNSSNNLKEHLNNVHTTEKRFQCLICQMRYKSRYGWVKIIFLAW